MRFDSLATPRLRYSNEAKIQEVGNDEVLNFRSTRWSDYHLKISKFPDSYFPKFSCLAQVINLLFIGKSLKNHIFNNGDAKKHNVETTCTILRFFNGENTYPTPSFG